MPEINPEQLNKWVELLWSVGWRGLVVLAVIYYRDTVSSVVKGVIEILVSWLKRKI